jgi:hypothetical protein
MIMRSLRKIITVLLALTVIMTATGCSGKSDPIVGIWKYEDTESGMTAIYDLRKDGTGTYTMNTGNGDVVYELKYELDNGHLLVTYVNNEIFSEDDVFDSEYKIMDADNLVVKDTFGTEMTFVRQ